MKKNSIRVICCVMALAMLVLYCGCNKTTTNYEVENDEPVMAAVPENVTSLSFVCTGVASFSDSTNGKIGLIGSDNQIILNAEYDSVKYCSYCDEDGAVILTKGGSEYTFHLGSKKLEDGNLCAHGIDEHLYWNSEKSCVYVGNGDGATKAEKGDLPKKGEVAFLYGTDGIIGLVGHSGDVVAEASFDEGTPFVNGLAAVKKNGRWGYINAKGEQVIGFYYDSVYSSVSCDNFENKAVYDVDKNGYLVLNHDSLYGIFNVDGDIVSAFTTKPLLSFGDGNYAIMDAAGNWKVGNMAGILSEVGRPGNTSAEE